MNELPENINLARQLNNMLVGKTISNVFNATSLHRFAFFYGDPLTYGKLLIGKRVESAEAYGMYVDILLNGDAKLTAGDGTVIRYGDTGSKIPSKYQLLVTFDDETFLSFGIAMFGSIAAYTGINHSKYYQLSHKSISPLSEEFDESYFEQLFSGLRPTLPVKLFLATEQRIPGLGNGVLQDILFNARINPKRQISSLKEEEKSGLFRSIKRTLVSMLEEGGRDTETDLFGNKGGYKTILSKNTVANPCPVCGGTITKEAFHGGAVYYCPACQRL